MFFITNAGRVPMVDMEVRAASVQVAVKFAQRWDLAGIVFACEPLLLCPRLVGFVKARGLVCATYGVLNNESETVKVCAYCSSVDVFGCVDQLPGLTDSIIGASRGWGGHHRGGSRRVGC